MQTLVNTLHDSLACLTFVFQLRYSILFLHSVLYNSRVKLVLRLCLSLLVLMGIAGLYLIKRLKKFNSLKTAYIILMENPIDSLEKTAHVRHH